MHRSQHQTAAQRPTPEGSPEYLRDAIVVFADEAFLADDKEAAGALKAWITEPELPIEAKFKDLAMCRNLIHLIVASNNDKIIDAAPEERRFCVLDVSDARIKDHSYFGAIERQMKNGGRAAMLYDLLHEDLKDFNIRTFPVTAALMDQKILSLRPFEKWWFAKLNEGHVLPDADKWQTVVPKDDLVTDYNTTAAEAHFTAQELRTHLAKLLPGGYLHDGKRGSIADGRKRTWILPTLAECRQHFENMFNMRVQWPTEVDDDA